MAAVLIGVVLILGLVRAIGEITEPGTAVAPEPPPTPLPTFDSTPDPRRFIAVDVIASQLADKGLACDLEFRNLAEAGHKGVSAAICDLLAEDDYAINLLVFSSSKIRDSWLLGSGHLPVVFGPNWMIVADSLDVARAVNGAIGGELREPAADGTGSPTVAPSGT